MVAKQPSRMTARDKAFVVAMCVTLAQLTANYALLATFFPIDMAERGMSKYMISIVFVAFDIGKLATSLVAGALASRFGRRALLVGGVLLAAVFGGLVGVVPDLSGGHLALMGPLFATARAFQGSGVALAQQSILATLSDTFPDSRGLVMGSAGSMLALGYFVGPPLGGVLYSASGFRLPFLVNGVLMALCALPVLSLHPSRPVPGALPAADRATPLAELECADGEPADAPSTPSGLEELSVPQLKAALDKRRIDHVGVIDKAALIERMRIPPPPPSVNEGGAPTTTAPRQRSRRTSRPLPPRRRSRARRRRLHSWTSPSRV